MAANHSLKHYGLMAALFITMFFIQGHALSREHKVTITPQTEYKQTRYTLTAGDNQDISLVTYQTEINQGILRLRSASSAPLNEQIAILSQLFKTVRQKEPHQKFDTLFIGGLISAFGPDNHQMALKLAQAAHASPQWDNQNGRSTSGHENNLLIQLANTAPIYPELNTMFANHGYAVRISGIEKVFINRVDKLPIAEALTTKGIQPSARLPYDCLTWFALSPKKK